MDEQQTPSTEQEDDVEAHGLKETVAAAAVVGALAVPAAAQAHFVAPDAGGDSIVLPAKEEAKKAGKKGAKKVQVQSGLTSPKKPILNPDE
jgi:hypothetical protein